MAHRILVILLLAFSFLAGVPAVSAQSDITTGHGSTVGAGAGFSNFDGCVSTFAGVDGQDLKGSDRPANGDASVAHLNLYVYDSCAQPAVYTLRAQGQVSLPVNGFWANGSLTRGSLRATIPVVDEISGRTFNVTVAMDWVTAEYRTMERYSFQVVYEDELVIVKEKFHLTFRNATASGSITDGTTEYASGTGYGEIDKGFGQYVVIPKNPTP